MGLIPVSRRSPGGSYGNPLFLSGESHGQKSLAGYSPQDLKESNMTEATYHSITYIHIYILHFPYPFIDQYFLI